MFIEVATQMLNLLLENAHIEKKSNKLNNYWVRKEMNFHRLV